MTLRLVAIAIEHWRDFDGWAGARGIGDPWQLHPSRLCTLIWHWMTVDRDPKDIAKVESTLWKPPPGRGGEGVWSAESEMKSFRSLRAKLGQ